MKRGNRFSDKDMRKISIRARRYAVSRVNTATGVPPSVGRRGRHPGGDLMINLSRAIGISALAAAIGWSSLALAQTYPNQPVRILVPFSAGSATDILARLISDKLSERLGQPVIVENRPGPPGSTAAAKSPADGYTLMLTSNGHTISGIVNRNLSFDPVKDFSGVTLVATVPYCVIVPPDFPPRNIKELIELAKANPGKLNFAASGGVGSSTFIATVLFRQAAGIDVVSVPYKGAPESLGGVMRNDAQMYFGPVNVAAELMAAGKVRILAVATSERVPTMKDVPTIAESGLPGFKYEAWFGIMAPANTPRGIISRLNAEIGDILRRPDVTERLAATGALPLYGTPDEFDKIIAKDTARLTEMFKDGVK
jgi:tripartite-type tricarboxylate transporter receptor subunit TctC